ncbi:flavodoxin family protein [Marinicella sediminis]|uniref:Flavodoxin family protein n=1 Tax=Marinicella sediminis TaxID=1792834 RepID=A0ABV7J8A0_9GAMM|nr:NAD(P)H-dependent oxidoreductase [Marinicella sediminis]
MKGLIIMGSSRSDGDTAAAVRSLVKLTGFHVLDLATLEFSDYDYQSRNLEDDFLPTIRRVVSGYDQWVMATPVYWYTMSALMKRFFDRISDCLRIEKDTGRQFRGMRLAALSVSNDRQPPGFDLPFKLSADYLGMQYLGDQHVILGMDEQLPIAEQLMPLVNTLKTVD